MSSETKLEHPYAPAARAVASVAARPDEVSLRRRLVSSLSWEVGGHLGMQLWRFVGNMILTRLIAPEAFGVIGLTQVVVMALTLLSDMGLSASVIHHPRGKDPHFLDTVWTVSLIRGVLLWLGTCAVAIPFAALYELPELAWVLPLVGITAVVRATASTTLLTSKRDLKNYWYVSVECGSQMVGTAVSVALAFMLRSVAALAWGWIASGIAYTILSHFAPGARHNWFRWDRDAVHSLVTFGRWAMASSGVTILQERGDRLLLGKVINAGDLGKYVIGANLAAIPMTIYWRIQLGVAHPLYARIRHDPPDILRSKLRRLRLGIVSTLGPALVGLIVLGQPLVNLIYSDEYTLAGWYVQLAGLAALIRVATDLGPIFMAYGEARTHFGLTVCHAMSAMLGMTCGLAIGAYFGYAGNGLLYGFAVAPLLVYPYQAMLYRRLNAWFPEIDILGVTAATMLIAAQALHMI